MFLNPNEEKVISELYKNLDNVGGSVLTLIWESGYIKATFDTCFEDMDDETDEEFYSFVFFAEGVSGKPPVEISDDGFFLINYKNFPSEILPQELFTN